MTMDSSIIVLTIKMTTLHVLFRFIVILATKNNNSPCFVQVYSSLSHEKQRWDSHNPMKAGTLLQPATSRNSAARQSEISQSMSGDEEIPHPSSLISEKKRQHKCLGSVHGKSSIQRGYCPNYHLRIQGILINHRRKDRKHCKQKMW